jgi:hypothetical protein
VTYEGWNVMDDVVGREEQMGERLGTPDGFGEARPGH